MKKIAILMTTLILFSCGSSNEKVEKKETSTTQEIPSVNAEKEWEEFTIGAIGNTMTEMKYDIQNITVNEGSWVRITLVNEGVDAAMIHNIVFVNYGTRKEVAMQAIDAGPDNKYVPNNSNVIAYSDIASPGETVVLEFKAPQKGNYEFVCTYPGHSEMMKGYFFVK